MAATVDIAGALAPATSRPSVPGEQRPDGTTRSANAAGKTKSHSVRASRSAKAAADADGAFDTQLDAVLPGAGEAKCKAPAAKGAPTGASDEDGADVQSRDQASAGAVLTPWMFVAPADVAPDVTVDSGPVASGAEAAEGVQATEAPLQADAASGAEQRTDAVPRSGPPIDVPGIHKSLTMQPGVVDVSAGQPAPKLLSDEAAVSDAPARNTAAPGSVGAEASNASESGSVAPSSAPVEGTDRTSTTQMPAAPAASSNDASAATGTTSNRATQPGFTFGAGQPDSPPRPTVADAAIDAPQSQTPVVAAPPAATGAANEVTQQQASVAGQAAAVASNVTPVAGARTNSTRAEATGVKASPAVHTQQRHGGQIAATRESTRTQAAAGRDASSGGKVGDVSANAPAIDDQRRNESSGDADLPASKAFGVAVGSAPPAPEGLPPASPGGLTHTTMSAVPTMDGGRQVSVDALSLAEPLPAPTGDVPDPDTPHRLVQSLRMQFLRGGGDAVVQLRPEHLGEVTVSLRVEQGSVAARITAADPVVAEWLQAHQGSLREGLQANGLTLERLTIDRDGRSPDRRERREPPPRQRFRQPSEPQSTFELTI